MVHPKTTKCPWCKADKKIIKATYDPKNKSYWYTSEPHTCEQGNQASKVAKVLFT